MGEAAGEWFDVPEGVPAGRCGATFESTGVARRPGAVTCWRAPWPGHDRCVWHAPIVGKPTDALAEAREDGPERLDGAVLRGVATGDAVAFDGCTLRGVQLQGAALDGASLAGADLRDADLTGATLSGADCTGADLTGATLLDVDLSGATLQGTDLTGAGLRGATLADAALFDATLDHVDLEESDLSGATLVDAALPDARLRGADLSGARLRGADLSDADLTGVALEGGDLAGADLSGADLSGADLTGVDLQGTDLAGADLRGAALEGVSLRDTTFDGAEINEATTFGGRSGHERRADAAAREATPWNRLPVLPHRALGRLTTHPEPLSQAEVQYRSVRRLLREHDLQQDPDLVVREKHARRKRMLAEWEPRRLLEDPRAVLAAPGAWLWHPAHWLTLAAARWVTLYGESPWRVVATALAVILGGALVYPHVGMDGLSLFDRLYFSVTTFTSLDSQVTPETPLARAVAMGQSLLGTGLFILLVAVLGRRITR